MRFSIRVSRIPFLHLTETRRTREAEEPIARTEGLTEEKAEETEEDLNARAKPEVKPATTRVRKAPKVQAASCSLKQ